MGKDMLWNCRPLWLRYTLYIYTYTHTPWGLNCAHVQQVRCSCAHCLIPYLALSAGLYWCLGLIVSVHLRQGCHASVFSSATSPHWTGEERERDSCFFFVFFTCSTSAAASVRSGTFSNVVVPVRLMKRMPIRFVRCSRWMQCTPFEFSFGRVLKC